MRISNVCDAAFCLIRAHNLFDLRLPVHCLVCVTVYNKRVRKLAGSHSQIAWPPLPLKWLLHQVDLEHPERDAGWHYSTKKLMIPSQRSILPE
jgi:hypothetical protein